MTFTEMLPQERMMFIAKIYHNIWYDEKRFILMDAILNEWDKNPIKEAKFLHEIDNEKNNQDGI